MKNINKTMSDKESLAYIKGLIAKGDPKLKPMKKPKTQKEVQAIIQGQMDLLRNNPKFLEKILGSGIEAQRKMNAKYGKDK